MTASEEFHPRSLVRYRVLFMNAADRVYGAANIALNQGDISRATEWGEAALALYRAMDNQMGIADTLNLIGIVSREQGAYGRAISPTIEPMPAVEPKRLGRR